MIPTLRTPRLQLRPLRPGDAAALATALDDWDVIRWLSGPPFPYKLADAHVFVDQAVTTRARVWAIAAREGGLCGVIGLADEFGYWLRRGVWGRGLATEAAHTVLDWHFGNSGAALDAGIHPDNDRSRRVLEKLGFVESGEQATFFPSRMTEVRRPMFRLEPDAWARLRAASE